MHHRHKSSLFTSLTVGFKRTRAVNGVTLTSAQSSTECRCQQHPVALPVIYVCHSCMASEQRGFSESVKVTMVIIVG